MATKKKAAKGTKQQTARKKASAKKSKKKASKKKASKKKASKKKVAAKSKQQVTKKKAQKQTSKKKVARKPKKPATKKKASGKKPAKKQASSAKKASKKKARASKKAAPQKRTAARKPVEAQAAPESEAKERAQVAASSSLGVGQKAPSFKLSDQHGNVVDSAELAGKPYVIYFYPRDNTSGCTREACDFRDALGDFDAQGVRVLGVSGDSEKSHSGFAEKYSLPFTLLADTENQLSSAYGSWVEKQNYGRTYMGISRSTFVVDKDGVIQKAWRSVKVDGHVAAVLEQAKQLS